MARIGWLLPRALCLVLGLASVTALRADDPVRATDYQDGHTLVLRVTDRYQALLKAAYDQLGRTFDGSAEEQMKVRRLYEFRHVLLPPKPVDPFEYLVFGRLSSLQPISNPDACITSFKNFAVQVAMRMALAIPLPGGELPDLDARAFQAENEPWLLEIQSERIANPNFRVRYVHIRDFLNPTLVSRFHFSLKQVPVDSPSASSSPFAPSYVYCLAHLGGTNPTWVHGSRVDPLQPIQVPLGAPIRFGTATYVAKAYLERIAAAGDRPPKFRGLPALTLRDLGLEFELAPVTLEDCLAARARINTRLDPDRAWDLVSQRRPPASEVELERILARERAQADDESADPDRVDAAAAAPAQASPEARPKRKLDLEGSERKARRKLDETGASAVSAASSASSGQAFPGVPLAAMEEALTCGVCSNVIFDAVILDCGHPFCRSCIANWFKASGTQKCPLCRAQHHGAPIPGTVLNQIIELWAARLLEDRWQNREAQAAQCESAREEPAGRHAQVLAALAEDHEIHHHTVDFAQARNTVCHAGQCLRMIAVGEARVSDQRVAPLPAGRPRHYHLHCWALLHSADHPRPVLRGREALRPLQRAVVNQAYPEHP